MDAERDVKSVSTAHATLTATSEQAGVTTLHGQHHPGTPATEQW